jgi:ABC-2 type transport system ATP-binding protein
MTEAQPAIEVTELTRSFRAQRSANLAVDHVGFTVKKGQIFGLLGPNGAGKTTIVRMLWTSGSARVMGHDIMREALKVRQQIAVVLQENAVETLLSVRDNLMIYGALHGLSRTDCRRRVEEVMETYDLKTKEREKAQDLSLGMRRRLQVAKVLLVDSPVLFLDEATTGMDPIIKVRTLETIRNLARNGKTIFLTTQLLEEAEELCDEIVILNKGKTIASGNLDTLRSLATNTFHVSLTFSEFRPEAFDALRAMNPQSMEPSGRTVELKFSGEESELLQKLAAVAGRWRIERFDVRGADLEDIFIELVGK